MTTLPSVTHDPQNAAQMLQHEINEQHTRDGQTYVRVHHDMLQQVLTELKTYQEKERRYVTKW